MFLSTGRQGAATVDALLATGKFDVYGTTRSGASPKLAAKGVTGIKFAYGSEEAADAALKESGAEMVWFTTLMASRATEARNGKFIVEACKKAGVKFVCFSSVADADKCPETVGHFKSKLEIEEALKASGMAYSILRPVAFIDNFDDAANWNPLKKGSVKSLWGPELKVKLVACSDIGKAGAIMLSDTKKWNGKTLDCASCEVDGNQVARQLSEASGTECKYAVALPRWVMWLFMNDLHHMVKFFEDTGYSSSIDDFKKVVAGAVDPKGWFIAKGQWADGEKFAPK